jgi:hypothetical protein
MCISIGEVGHTLLPNMMEGTDLMLHYEGKLPHPSIFYTGKLRTNSRNAYVEVGCGMMSSLIGGEFLDKNYHINDIQDIDDVCAVSGSVIMSERHQKKVREAREDARAREARAREARAQEAREEAREEAHEEARDVSIPSKKLTCGPKMKMRR